MTQENQRALQMLSTALEMEEKGYKFYDKAIDECGVNVARDIYRMLRDDEIMHAERIKTIYTSLTGGEGWSDNWKQVQEAHEDLGGVFRKLAQEHGSKFHCEVSDVEALDVGIDFESKSVAFYKENLPKAEGDLEREFVEQMIAEEIKHHELLLDMKFYLTDPDGWFREKEHLHVDGA